MKLITYLKKNGIKWAIKVLYMYKIDSLIEALMKPFLMKCPLKNIILIESHNDFDNNGGALYDYLIENNYNNMYKIVWLVKHNNIKYDNLPENVECLPLFKPNIKKCYYVWTAKVFSADNTVVEKRRKDQKSFYLSHGAGGLKAVKGKLFIPDSVDYILMQSEKYAPQQAYQWSLEYPNKKFIYIGYPAHDFLAKSHKTEIQKITNETFRKVVLWMPTFRRGLNNRNDSDYVLPLGIPLIQCAEEYQNINEFLKLQNLLLIIKIHPMQDLSNLGIKSISNIKVLTADNAKDLGVNNYKLMSAADALISDYSGAAFEFLQVNKPISYVFSDLNEYKLGLIDSYNDYIAGDKIYTIKDLYQFLNDIANNIDRYAEKRNEIRDYIYKYHDENNCKRLVEYMNLNR